MQNSLWFTIPLHPRWWLDRLYSDCPSLAHTTLCHCFCCIFSTILRPVFPQPSVMAELLNTATLVASPRLSAAPAGTHNCFSSRQSRGRPLALRSTSWRSRQQLSARKGSRHFSRTGAYRFYVANCSLFLGDLLPHVVRTLPIDGLQRALEDLASMPDNNVVSSLVRTGVSAMAQIPDSERWPAFGGAVAGWVYLTIRPGVLWGAFDAYILTPIQAVADSLLGRRNWKRTDFLVGQRLGEGSFGTVYAGALLPRNIKSDDEIGRRSRRLEEYEQYKTFQRVILKKVKVGVQGAEECGEVEEWFNYRMSRAAPDVCAEFLGSFIADTTRGQFTEGGKWLVWKFEGDSTLGDFMKDRNFPENLEVALFGDSIKDYTKLRKKALIIKKLMRQIITSLKKVHETGIVHRDVKPSNLVVTNKGKVKLIDFGAATDLRIGKNYVPNRGMLDPDYCPPELYVMPEETPKPPPAPLAAIMSPVIWQFNAPDLFDMYSVGVIFLQMACATLRTSMGLQTFKSELEAIGYDLKKWRQSTKLRLNLELLDFDGGKGWDLATKLVCERGFLRRGRLSASAALRHPYFLLGGDQAVSVLSKLTPAK